MVDFNNGYGNPEANVHLKVVDDTCIVELAYPPRSDGDPNKVKYVEINQESVRASDGIRVHYDYDRDGFVVEQCEPKLVKNDEHGYEDIEIWKEVGFFQSWAFGRGTPDGQPTAQEWLDADQEYEKRKANR